VKPQRTASAADCVLNGVTISLPDYVQVRQSLHPQKSKVNDEKIL